MKYRLFLSCMALLLAGCSVLAAAPEWIWFQKSSGAEVRYFRKTFNVEGKVTRAEVTATGDDAIEVFVNGEPVLRNSQWQRAVTRNVADRLATGTNVIALVGRNGDSSAAALLARLTIVTDRGTNVIVTDKTWKASATASGEWQELAYNDGAWGAVTSLGAVGVEPWGDVLGGGGGRAARAASATPVEALHVAPGFKAELLHSATAEEGSWVAMTTDDKGRLIISPQFSTRSESDRGLLRLTLGADGKVSKREFIAKPMYDAQGMLFVDGTLYVVVNRYSSKYESGLYRVRDTGNDQFEDIQLVKKLPGSGEHGPHAIVQGPDKHIYVMCGNHTKVPEGIDPASPHRNYGEDHVLPRQWDGNGHAANVLAPGGYVLRTDLEFKKWELYCGGFRNAYDIAFNVDGELFTFDSDMEWDWGMPWYRPTRVNHIVSAGEYGWRSGTGKWPEYYPDSLGAIDIGLGSPTGVEVGTGAKFPAKYQRALYILDWTYGRVIAVHLTPNGATYTGTYENFVAPRGLVQKGADKRPLNVTDIVVGKDGAMYFTIGGRNVQAGLYRVTYTGSESTAPVKPNTEGMEARKLRRQLEAFHGKQNAAAVATAWPHLGSEDRFIRHAARIAVESQPVGEWKEKALSEKRPNAGIAALLALARTGGAETQADLLRALQKFPLSSLTEEQALAKLRVVQLSLVRQGKPSPELAKHGVEKLDALFPNPSPRMNRELAQLLIALEAPSAIEKSLRLMASATTQEDQNHYLFHLRTAKDWTLDQRREYFRYFAERTALPHPPEVLRWFEEAGRPYSDGASYANFMKNFYNEAVSLMPTNQKAAIEKLLTAVAPTGSSRRRNSQFPNAQQRSVVKEWKMGEIEPLLERVSGGRNFERGRQAYVDAQCLLCHKIGDEGGGVGPDLTAVASRFSRRDILEAILDPSKVVSEQFLNTTIATKDDEDHTGRLVDETTDKVVLQPNPLQPQLVEIKKSNIKSRDHSKLSPMPEGLASVLTQEEILDLLAFLESGGNARHAAFKK